LTFAQPFIFANIPCEFHIKTVQCLFHQEVDGGSQKAESSG